MWRVLRDDRLREVVVVRVGVFALRGLTVEFVVARRAIPVPVVITARGAMVERVEIFCVAVRGAFVPVRDVTFFVCELSTPIVVARSRETGLVIVRCVVPVDDDFVLEEEGAVLD